MDAAVSLTEQECKVYQEVLLGKCNKEIARELHISVRTVRFHMANILAKHGLGNRVELLANFASLRRHA